MILLLVQGAELIQCRPFIGDLRAILAFREYRQLSYKIAPPSLTSVLHHSHYYITHTKKLSYQHVVQHKPDWGFYNRSKRESSPHRSL